ncbi:MAG: lipopolysaccharide biosynthesis protein [Gemmatimonadaceae bacterium]
MRAPLARLQATLARSGFVRNAFALISGTVATQAIVFLCAPFLSRIFSVADFGNFANYSAWVAFLALTGSLRYEHAIIVAKDRAEANRVFALTMFVCVISVVIFEAVALAISAGHSGGGYLREIAGILPYIPLGVLSACMGTPLAQLHIRTGLFRRLAAVGVAQVVASVAAQVILGVLKVNNGLIIGSIVGNVVSAAALAPLLWDRETMAQLRDAVTMRQLRDTARTFVNFPRYTLPGDAIGVVTQQFFPVFVLALFGPTAAGLYAFSARIVRVPLIVVATAVSAALRNEAMLRLQGEGDLARLFSKTMRGLFLVSLLPFAAMLLYSHEIFALVFGAKWREAGTIVRILSPGILFEFVAFPLSVFFLVTGTQRYTFRIQLVGFISLATALWIGHRVLNNFIATCGIISALMVAVNLASIILAARVSRKGVVLVPPVADAGLLAQGEAL